MADDVTVDNGTLTDYVVSADAATADGALVQRVKLAYSADGVTTHLQADSEGLLVNLGANNDVLVPAIEAIINGGALTVGDGGGQAPRGSVVASAPRLVLSASAPRTSASATRPRGSAR